MTRGLEAKLAIPLIKIWELDDQYKNSIGIIQRGINLITIVRVKKAFEDLRGMKDMITFHKCLMPPV